MTLLQIAELFRNFGLVVLAAVGIYFAARQLQRARKRDAYDLFVKASELMSSDDESVRNAGLALMADLRNERATRELAIEAISLYIENASDEERAKLRVKLDWRQDR